MNIQNCVVSSEVEAYITFEVSRIKVQSEALV